MERALKSDDLVGAVALLGAELARELDGAFVGLRAGVREEHLVEAAALGEGLRQTDARFVEESGAGRDEHLRLPRQRFGQNSWRVPQAVHRPALHEIQVLAPVLVPQPGAFALDEHHVGPGGDLHQRADRITLETHSSSPSKSKRPQGLPVAFGFSALPIGGQGVVVVGRTASRASYQIDVAGPWKGGQRSWRKDAGVCSGCQCLYFTEQPYGAAAGTATALPAMLSSSAAATKLRALCTSAAR